MAPANRTNPDLTDVNGHFGWDVIAGFYKVRAEKAGCTDPNNSQVTFVETQVYEIPPPVTDIDLRLDCGEPPLVWGNMDCADGIKPLDALLVLGDVANVSIGLSAQADVCPTIGDTVTVDGSERTWGNVDCEGGVVSTDAVKILQYYIGIQVAQTVQGCPELGQGITLGGP